MVVSREARRGYAWVLGVVIGVTLLKGFRFPNLYAATHFVLNYSCGFMRRGLVGEVMQRLLGDLAFTYEVFVGFAFLLLVMVVLGFAWCVFRVISADPLEPLFRCALLVFASSPGLVFFVHILGYLDYIGLLAVLGVLLWAPRSPSTFTLFYVVALCAIGFAFVHEILAVMFMPVFGFLMLSHIFRAWPTQSTTQRTWMCVHAGATVAFALVLSWAVSTVRTQDVATVGELQSQLLSKVNFGLRPDAFSALARSSADNLSTLLPWYWKYNKHAQLAPGSWLAILPSILFLLRYGAACIRRLPLASWMRWVLCSSMLATVLVPQLLNLVGWDWNRWNAISLLGCFVCVIATKLYFPKTEACDSDTAALLTVGAIALVLSLASTTPLFDEFEVQFFPFEDQVKFILDLLDPTFRYRPAL